MLDIAEHVFSIIAERLKAINMTIRSAFGKQCNVIESYEGQPNVEILSPMAFLDSLKNYGINELSELEVACMMRVLSKPELEHSVILNELQLVMENFGLPIEAEG